MRPQIRPYQTNEKLTALQLPKQIPFLEPGVRVACLHTSPLGMRDRDGLQLASPCSAASVACVELRLALPPQIDDQDLPVPRKGVRWIRVKLKASATC